DGFGGAGARFGVQGAVGAFHNGRLGDDVRSVAGLDAGDAHDDGVPGVDLAADDALQGGEDVGRHDDGIDGTAGVGPVAAFAFDHDAEEVRAGHDGAGADG